MTIGIGVLCSTKPRPHAPRPDAIVMLSDTMGSTETDSTDQLHKMLVDKDRLIFAVCADRLERCGDLWPTLLKEVDALPVRNHGGYLEAFNKATMLHRAQHFKYDVLYSRYAMNDQLMFGDAGSAGRIQQEWARYDSRVAMIVAAFDAAGQALQYVILSPGDDGGSWVQPVAYPGYTSIGSGCYNANFWLNYRHQHLSLSIRQSIYHAYEASRMAATAPTVNDELEIMVATKEGFMHTCTTFPEPPNFPLSFDTLSALFRERGPQGTSDLELFAQPKSAMSSGTSQT